MCSPDVRSGAVTMKTMRSTNITSTSGVTLISRKAPPARGLFESAMCPALLRPRPTRCRADGRDQGDGRIGSQRTLGDERDPFGRSGLEVRHEVAHALVDP